MNGILIPKKRYYLHYPDFFKRFSGFYVSNMQYCASLRIAPVQLRKLGKYHGEYQPENIKAYAGRQGCGNIVGNASKPAFKVLHFIYYKRFCDVEESEKCESQQYPPCAIFRMEKRQEAKRYCAEFVKHNAPGIAHFQKTLCGIAYSYAYICEYRRENYVPAKPDSGK